MQIKFDKYDIVNEESSIRFPTSLNYWEKKGKNGKRTIIYTHNDLDGIFSAIAMKEYLISRGFEICGYGVIDYEQGWKVFNLDKTYINICVDYAEDHPDLDLYIDHHMEEGDVYKKSEHSIKMHSDCCYYLVCLLLGMPTDKYILDVISMIDAAKYDEYSVDIKTILNFNLEDILKNENPRLVFAGAFNQLMKRSDFRTIIEVVHNGSLSIFKIFKLFKIFYPLNNLKIKRGSDKDVVRTRLLRGETDPDVIDIPAFVPDSVTRLEQMAGRTLGVVDKPVIYTFDDFLSFYWDDAKGKLKFDGFAIIKNLVYVPVGTWANALRARALIEKSLGKYDKRIQFILLDYGSSLQIAAYKNLDTIPNLPTLKSGEVLNDLDKYTRFLVNFVLPRFFDFKYKGAKAGGHKGIGNLSNILGACEKAPFIGIKYMDLMKNWIIHDITGIKWKLNMAWNENPPETRPSKEKIMNQKLMMVDEIRKVKI